MRRLLLASAAILALSAGAALAAQCPSMMAAIDDALPAAQVSDEVRARAIALRQEGEALHDAGDHAGSEAALAEAMEILGL
jgi:hypothetical protein